MIFVSHDRVFLRGLGRACWNWAARPARSAIRWSIPAVMWNMCAAWAMRLRGFIHKSGPGSGTTAPRSPHHHFYQPGSRKPSWGQGFGRRASARRGAGTDRQSYLAPILFTAQSVRRTWVPFVRYAGESSARTGSTRRTSISSPKGRPPFPRKRRASCFASSGVLVSLRVSLTRRPEDCKQRC
jgi:hypothetical protein